MMMVGKRGEDTTMRTRSRGVPQTPPVSAVPSSGEEKAETANKSRKFKRALTDESSGIRRSSRTQQRRVCTDIADMIAQGKSPGGRLETSGAGDGSPVQASKKAKKQKLRTTKMVTLENNSDGEPSVCTRCGNKTVSMDHFFRLHNGMLAEEQKTFSKEEKRKRYLQVQAKGIKLHCQNDFCEKVLKSVTAMVYHENVCGVEAEKILCHVCGKSIQSTYFKQHLNEHNRALGEFKRRGKWFPGNLDSKETEESISRSPTVEPEPHEAVTADTTEEEPSTSAGRPKRNSAVAATKRFQKIARSDFGDSDVDEEHKISGSESGDDSAADEDMEIDEVSPEEGEEDEDKAIEVRFTKKVYAKTEFLPNRKFPRVDMKWRQTLRVLGYARCEMVDCDYIGYNLEQMIHHNKSCTLKYSSFALLKCVKYGCRFSARDEKLIVRHYIRAHGETAAEAKRLRTMKKVPFIVFQKKKHEPSQADIDALKLFD